MKRKLFILVLVIIFLLILPPLLAPITFNGSTQKSAIRAELVKRGHPYQSFIAIISKDGKDVKYGERYHVAWKDFNNITGTTPWIFYVKQNKNGKYSVVSSGTGP